MLFGGGVKQEIAYLFQADSEVQCHTTPIRRRQTSEGIQMRVTFIQQLDFGIGEARYSQSSAA